MRSWFICWWLTAATFSLATIPCFAWTTSRRAWLQRIIMATASSGGGTMWTTSHALAFDQTRKTQIETPLIQSTNDYAHIQHPFRYSNDWMGTKLPLLTLDEAVTQFNHKDNAWPMARWPDPILRRPALPVPSSYFGTPTLQRAADLLVQTASQNEAVGLAAQQCGVDARLVVLLLQRPDKRKDNQFRVMVNPHIIDRSPEVQARVWTEHCLVLPPTLAVTVVRDATVTVAYHTVDGRPVTATLTGEAARAVQHELDHDRGILVTDHILVDSEWPADGVMRAVEQPGHAIRQVLALTRYVDEDEEDDDDEDEVLT